MDATTRTIYGGREMTKEEAIKELIAMKPHIESGMSVVGADAYDMAIEALKEQRTGKWEQVTVTYCAELDDKAKEVMAIASMFCPECRRYHNEVYLYGNPTYGVKYCPNCGAKMEGEQQ